MSNRRPIYGRRALVALALGCFASPAHAVNIVLDYSYDATSFFGAGNPSGATAGNQAKAAIEAVASFYSGILTDTLSAIVEPPNYVGPMGGTAYFDWSIEFDNPSTGAMVTIAHPTIAANAYRIYVGARNIASLGIGGPGGFEHTFGYNAFPSEVPEILQINDDFVSTITTRGEDDGFANWGGAVTFDASGTAWNYNHMTAPSASTNDFYSVAIHEIGHALGLGASDEWSALASGAFFAGSAAAASYGSAPPLEPPNQQGKRGHWKSGTMSRVFGTNTPQEAAMDPEVTQGSRKLLTSLDAAALVDLGWSVNEPSSPTYHPADFNEDHNVNGGDLTRWRSWYGSNAMADADGDGDSDGRDFLLWQRAVGTVQSGPNGSGVPEPAGAALAAWGAMLLMRRPLVLRTSGQSRARLSC